jgi:hypothetical protein
VFGKLNVVRVAIETGATRSNVWRFDCVYKVGAKAI